MTGASSLRVLHVYKTYFPDTMGGIEKVLLQLTEGLSRRNVRNRILVLSPNPTPSVIVRSEAEVFRYPITFQVASNPFSWQAWKCFPEHVTWADIVHYQFPWPFADLLYLGHGRKKPSVVTYQSDIVRQKTWMKIYRPLMFRFLNSVDRVIATSPDYQRTSEVLAQLGNETEVIPNGLDDANCPPASEARVAHWRGSLGEGFGLFVGVLRYYKGLETLVLAASHVRARIVIAGDGPELDRLRALAKAESVTNLVFLGHVSEEDKAALLKLASVFVFPSHLRSEAFGMSLIEAAMHSKPMISCEIGSGMSYINKHNVTGLVVPPEVPRALASAIQLLVDNPRLAKTMGSAARMRYQALFTGEQMANSYYSLYQRVLGR